ncbi:MAG: GntR family transcriptional regulator [Chloroflexi bacterium]|jgi:DNA-binding GntR family transcriptional regulator|nr:GntR family transcriptional regulator [Chloroflexota bacterium]
MSTEASGTPELSLVDRVYRALRAGIVDGTYGPDTPLRLDALAKTNNVSRIPVREALRLLEKERLVVVTPNKGARVAPISSASANDLYRMRKLVEAEALYQGASNLSEAAIAELRNLILPMAKLFDSGDEPAFLALHRQFHFEIYKQSGSGWLMRTTETMWEHADRYFHLSIICQSSSSLILEKHYGMLDRISAGDLKGAVSELMHELDHGIDRIQAAIKLGLP